MDPTLLTSGGMITKEQFIKKLSIVARDYKIINTNKKVSYYNIPCSMDIEASSFYSQSGEKQSIMYETTIGINGLVTSARTWAEVTSILNEVVDILNVNLQLQLIIYIQNLGYEFQFMRKLFSWEKVFSLDVRKPVYALTTSGICFKCSYKLSNYSLKYIGKNLQKYKCEKMEGDLDYNLIRHSETPLTPREWKYCEYDVRVVMCFIQEEIEKCGDITRIPLTKTGYVRNYCRNSCMFEFKSHKKGGHKYTRYRNLMKSMMLTSDEYIQLKRAFQGGFTHANANYSGKTVSNVESFDFTSSYPYVMISEKFPMSSAEKINITSKEQFEENLKLYCCLFDVEFTEIESRYYIEHPLSISKCTQVTKHIVDNGRIVYAEHCFTTITEQDWDIYKHFYTWKDAKIYNFRRYIRGYLPTDFVKAILKLYQDKTTLKDVEGKEVEYLKSKEMVNSSFGMTVTDICRDDIVYDSTRVEWSKEKPDIQSAIDKYNNSVRRFLFYPWGVWVTAYARRNLFSGIYAAGYDYIYSDTDSIKIINAEKHMAYIENYNKNVILKLNRAMDYHKLPYDSYKPKTIKGKEKILGIWDDEGAYTRFKTIGAKRYMTEKDGNISITVSGVNKQKAVPYLLEKYGDKVFDYFDEGLKIPAEYTGKNILTYIDDEMEGDVTDYLGKTIHYYSPSGIHMEGCEYNMSLSAEYAEYLLGLREGDEI